MARSSILRMVLLALMWGSSFLWIKYALHSLNPMQVTTGRLMLGAIFLLGLCAVTGIRLSRDRTLWAHLLFVSLIGTFLPFALFSFAGQTVDSGLSGVLNATTPLWTLLIALLIRSERRPGPGRLAGLVLGFAGTLVILAPWQGVGGTLGGSLMAAAAAVCYGISLNYAARFVVPRGAHSVTLASMQISLAAGWGLLALPFGGLAPVDPAPVPLLAMLVLGLAGTGYAFVLVNRLLIDEGPTSTSTVLYLLPVIAVLLGAVFLGESLNARVLAGMVVVLGGVMLAQRRPKPPATVEPVPAESAGEAPAAQTSLRSAAHRESS